MEGMITAGRILVNMGNVEEISKWHGGYITVRFSSGRVRILAPSAASAFEYDLVMRGIYIREWGEDSLPELPSAQVHARVDDDWA